MILLKDQRMLCGSEEVWDECLRARAAGSGREDEGLLLEKRSSEDCLEESLTHAHVIWENEDSSPRWVIAVQFAVVVSEIVKGFAVVVVVAGATVVAVADDVDSNVVVGSG